MKAVFLDRDGTLVMEPYDGVITKPDNVWLQQDIIEALKVLGGLDYTFFLITMQPAIGQGRITMEDYELVNKRVLEALSAQGLTIAKTYVCPHAPFEGCDCKKPKPGLIHQAVGDYPDIELESSWMIGDRLEDVGLGKEAGVQTILLDREGKYVEGTADYLVANLTEAVQILSNPF